jgi:uncharacterized protein (TIGR02145 family)
MGTNMKKSFSLLIVVAMFLLTGLYSANACVTTINGGTTNYRTLQAAIDAASSGDVIHASYGVYKESLNITKSLTILGPNADISPNPFPGSRVKEAIIDLSVGTRFINVLADNVVIKGFEIKNSANAGAIMAGTFSPCIPVNGITIEKNYFHNLKGGAVTFISSASVPTANNWVITDNRIISVTSGSYFGGNYGAGINLVNISNVTLTNNTISYTGKCGIQLGLDAATTVSGNIISNTTLCGIQVAGGSGYTISNNTITNANTSNAAGSGGIVLTNWGGNCPDNTSVTGNIVSGSFNGFAIGNGDNITGKTIAVNGNNFSGNSNKAIYHGGTGILAATCNWYGTADENALQAIISGPVTYIPYSVSAGGTCTGGQTPVRIYACYSYTSPSGNYVWKISGTYEDRLVNQAGGDSLIIVDLTITDCCRADIDESGIVNLNDFLLFNSQFGVSGYACEADMDGNNQVNIDDFLLFVPKFNTSADIMDVDGNRYKTVIIDDKIWMTENIKTSRYNNGAAIPLVTDDSKWSALSKPGYCWYNNDQTTYGSTYGALYNWYTINTGNLCPTGWHAPTDAEWSTLTTFLGGESVAGDKLKETGTTHWIAPNAGATNEAGFTALPGGYRQSNGSFGTLEIDGFWWSSTDGNATNAYFRSMSSDHNNIVSGNNDKHGGFSIRCARDK